MPPKRRKQGIGQLKANKHRVNLDCLAPQEQVEDCVQQQAHQQAEQGVFDAQIDELLQNENIAPLFSKRSRRVAIGWMFANTYRGINDTLKTPWKSVDGIMPKICKAFGLHKSTDISDILQDIIDCKQLGQLYTGDVFVDANKRLGQPPIIELDLVEAQIICDYVEEAGSVCNAHSLVNEHHRQQNLASLAIEATRSVLKHASTKKST